ncbi:hypothetical protein Tco_0841667 [Tanacetum coccineum]|uniref:Uncharacterized protein n=1 Tax=Tanacetum coccineum TaxID=301880 RepID=A0ABQ5AX13_9ASTR
MYPDNKEIKEESDLLQMCLVFYRLQMCLVPLDMILPGYTSVLQIADVFGCVVTRLLYRLQMCLVSWYTYTLQIADVFGFGSALVCMHLPGYTSTLQIADVFASGLSASESAHVRIASD